MVLRKNLIGLHLKNIFTLGLERLIIIEFEGLDDVDDLLNKKLIIELMGKHSNVILLDEQNIIIDSLRHIKHDNESDILRYRDIIPHIRYVYPKSEKHDFLNINCFDDFVKIIKTSNNKNISTSIVDNFTGFSKSFVNGVVYMLKKEDSWIINDDFCKQNLSCLYDKFCNIINDIGSKKLYFDYAKNSDASSKDYFLYNSDHLQSDFYLNFFIDDFYYEKETLEYFNNYRNTLLKLILNVLHKYDKRLMHINTKLKDCDNMGTFRIYGELITANLYKFKSSLRLDSIDLENYYDNQKIINIPLDKRFSISQNAKLYFKKNNKLKNALEIVGIQKKETEQELDYIQSIVFELENASTIDNIIEIHDEISDNVIFKDYSKTKMNNKNRIRKSKLTKNKTVKFNPIKYNIDGYTILVGRNNVENDYLTLKYANKSDIWFHVKDFHGSHTILRLSDSNFKFRSDDNKNSILDALPKNLVIATAKLALAHSKAKNSSNVPVDYCEVKYVKKPSGSKPGMVIYTNYRTIYV